MLDRGVCACAGCGGDYCGGADCGALRAMRARASSHATEWCWALVSFVASALAQAAVVLTEGTEGTEGASKLARHGMVLGCGAICGVCACAGCGGDYCGGAEGASKLARHGMVGNAEQYGCFYYHVLLILRSVVYSLL